MLIALTMFSFVLFFFKKKKTRFGKDAKLPIYKSHCLCGHEIRQQCYVCPKHSTTTDDIITFGNRCINKWGYAPAIRGNGVKFKCECCGSIANRSGSKGT